MTERELSQRLDELATKLEGWFADDEAPEGIIWEVMQELKKLSNEKYAPGNSQSWSDVKKQLPASTKKTFTQRGKSTPF